MRNKIHKPTMRKTFKQAVEATADVQHCYKVGKQAIPSKDRDKVELTDSKKCGGSLFIDECLKKQNKYSNDNRWDYAIDYNGEVYFIEVHTASSSEVSTVIKKMKWLKDWLNYYAPAINSFKAEAPFYWVQSNRYDIPRNSRYERLADQNGIRPIPRLVLK